MDKLFKVTGVSDSKTGFKVRFANDLVSRIKILSKGGIDTQLMELPTAMTKAAAVTFLKSTDLYANDKYKECIDVADAKYNAVATVKVTKTAEKPSMEKLKAKAAAKNETELA